MNFISGKVATAGDWAEQAAYLELNGERIYTITCAPQAPLGWVLLCGPFPSDRLYSLAMWLKWARYLASQGMGVIRFDYRGTGESTGDFADMNFDMWIQDVTAMCQWACSGQPPMPLVLHGMGMGALLAQKAFVSGSGDALLMWSPPLVATEILRRGLMSRLSMDMLLYPPRQRKSAQQYLQELKADKALQVDGYQWSSRLWASGEALALDKPFCAEGPGVEPGSGRTWRHIALADEMAPLVRSSKVLRAMNPRAALVPDCPLNPEFANFFERNVSWIRAVPAHPIHAGCRAPSIPRPPTLPSRPLREALTLELDGLLLHGTSHLSADSGSVGVLVFNSGAQPRCSRGDLNVHLADALARKGFPCFRFDLPGLGDSQGELPREYLQLYNSVEQGGFGGVAASLAMELQRRFQLSGVVLMGICGGALTSVFAAATLGASRVNGLVLLDLPFTRSVSQNTIVARRNASPTLLGFAAARLSRWHARLHDWVLAQPWEPYATAGYHLLQRLPGRDKTRTLPENTNFKLLDTLQNVLHQGISTLLLTAHPPTPEPPSFDYIRYVAQRSNDRLEHAPIHGTTHSFVENDGPAKVFAAVKGWLGRFEPRVDIERLERPRPAAANSPKQRPDANPVSQALPR